jgi:hypothetical protein
MSGYRVGGWTGVRSIFGLSRLRQFHSLHMSDATRLANAAAVGEPPVYRKSTPGVPGVNLTNPGTAGLMRE